jgi:hypothetical protein
MASREVTALKLWRAFAGRPMVSAGGTIKTWREYTEGTEPPSTPDAARAGAEFADR